MKNGRISPLPHCRKFVRWGGGSFGCHAKELISSADRNLALQLEQVRGLSESFLKAQYRLRVVQYTQPIIVA
jgi:hypothetical protein